MKLKSAWRGRAEGQGEGDEVLRDGELGQLRSVGRGRRIASNARRWNDSPGAKPPLNLDSGASDRLHTAAPAPAVMRLEFLRANVSESRRTLGAGRLRGEIVLPTDLSSRTYLYQDSGDEQPRAS